MIHHQMPFQTPQIEKDTEHPFSNQPLPRAWFIRIRKI